MSENKFQEEYWRDRLHDIRSAVGGISGPVQLLQLDDLTEEQTEYVCLIEQSYQRILDLLNNIREDMKGFKKELSE